MESAGSMARDDRSLSDSETGSLATNRCRLLAILVMGVLPLLLAAAWVAVTAIRARSGVGRLAAEHLLTVDRPFPAEGRFPGDPYVSSKACASCHPGESALHARSGHALTLLPASRVELSRRLDGASLADPERADVRWAYRTRHGRLELSRVDRHGVDRWIVQYAFGSGHHATTFVNVLDPVAPAILEHRITYYARESRLGVTPGQRAAASPTPEVKPHGKELTPSESRKCFGCHSTQLSVRDNPGIDEETMIPNVSCERCHGPGRAHVERANQGAPIAQLAMPFGPNGWTADTQMILCGTCHRHPSRARQGQIRPDDPQLARFQPVGIMQSRCYRESGGAFSCVTCHDPHARASPDRAKYDSICLICHTGRGLGTRQNAIIAKAAGGSSSPGAACSVSPRGACVECHMPRVDSGQHILFTDHWIRIRHAGEPTPKSGQSIRNPDVLNPADLDGDPSASGE
jgi:hypothetical protein